MGDVILSIIVLLTFTIVFNRCYKVLWYKLPRLFELTGTTEASNEYSEMTNGITRNDNKFLYKFHTEYSLSSATVSNFIRVIVSGTFGLCIVAIEIVIWQIKTADDEYKGGILTTWLWPILILLLSLSLILVQPFCILITLFDKFLDWRWNVKPLLVPSCLATITWIFLLHYVTLGPFYFTGNLLTKLSILGVTIMSTLSGVASISTLYYVVMFFIDGNENAATMLNNVYHRVAFNFVGTAKLRERMANHKAAVEESIAVMKEVNDPSSVHDSLIREQLIEKIAWYQLEISRIEKLLQESREVRLAKRMFHCVFLLYCTYKLISTFFIRLPTIIFHAFKFPSDYNYENLYEGPEANTGDPLAVTLANIFDFFIFRFTHQQDLDALTKQVSLLLSISLFICSLSTVTTTISYLLTLLPMKLQLLTLSTLQDNNVATLPVTTREPENKCTGNPSIIKNLIVSELTGVYIISTILMVRSNLPYDVSKRLNELLGEKFAVPDIVIDVWFDKVFALSSILTFTGIVIAGVAIKKTL
ncbi:HCL398Wp [Eremothecium sinecaudum]|uniref:HCL398Wp n=1 Tax=Eremothecium sinecaudum TaxID=45286 RepID=A0A109UY91_9SACH|nr:HCL398Wp [Eremothecium sinecaudum]AMD19753.1 HCL398Wp [Eremothecium sinecaudum]